MVSIADSNSKPRVAVLLNGCGAKDGSEIHEAVLTLLALGEAGARPQCLALNLPQARVFDHLHQAIVPGATRNMLIESARIARGDIIDASTGAPTDFDALVIPGGNGTAYNLCNLADAGRDMEVHPTVASMIRGFYEQGKPLGAICIAPALLARVLGPQGITLTLGSEPDSRALVSGWGAKHVDCGPDQCVEDPVHKIVTTPAYMIASSPWQIWPGIRALAQTIVRWIETRQNKFS